MFRSKLLWAVLALPLVVACGPSDENSPDEMEGDGLEQTQQEACSVVWNTHPPYKSGDYVREKAVYTMCFRYKATFTLQRSRWYGWQNLDSATYASGSGTRYFSWKCAGTGTYTYRGITELSYQNPYTLKWKPKGYKLGKQVRFGC